MPAVPKALGLLLAFFILSAPLCSGTVETGLWQFESNLSDEQALAALSNISFQPAPEISRDAWSLASSRLQFSDYLGDISPSVVLMPSCLNATNCTRACDVYMASDGKMARIGRLSFKPDNIFQIDHSSLENQPATPALLPSGPKNASEGPAPPPSPSGAAISFVEQWISPITLAVVVGLTLIYLMRKRY